MGQPAGLLTLKFGFKLKLKCASPLIFVNHAPLSFTMCLCCASWWLYFDEHGWLYIQPKKVPPTLALNLNYLVLFSTLSCGCVFHFASFKFFEWKFRASLSMLIELLYLYAIEWFRYGLVHTDYLNLKIASRAARPPKIINNFFCYLVMIMFFFGWQLTAWFTCQYFFVFLKSHMCGHSLFRWIFWVIGEFTSSGVPCSCACFVYRKFIWVIFCFDDCVVELQD